MSVWITAQQAPATQRKSRYLAASTAHPGKMLPAIAAHAITHYTQPGDLVIDPMCGIGTTLIEAVHAGRHALGLEYETRWAAIARANLEHARDTATLGHNEVGHNEVGHNEVGHSQVVTGDARHLTALLPSEYAQQATLAITSPPYGASTHGQVTVTPAGIHKYDHHYGNRVDRANLANLGLRRLLAGFTRILAETTAYLRPGGHVVITGRPWRENLELINLPAHILGCGQQAGLIPVERCVALLARAAEHTLVARPSFFQRDFVSKQRDKGLPLHLITHEDILVFQKPTMHASPEKLKRIKRNKPALSVTASRLRGCEYDVAS